jgi:hypothetical protein
MRSTQTRFTLRTTLLAGTCALVLVALPAFALVADPPAAPAPEQPKPEQPKPEQPKPEQPKPEQPKPEQPKPAPPKTEPPPADGAQSPQSGTQPQQQWQPPAEGTEITRESLPPPPLVDGKKKRVHIIEDRFNEWSGTVEAETSDYIVIETKGKLRGFYKARTVEIVPLVEPRPGQPGVVTMRDGMAYRGIVLKDEFDFVEIEIEGIRQRFPRSAVLRTTLVPTARETYDKLREKIKPDQYSERMVLCRWLFEQRMYREAREELLSLLEATELFEAKELLRMVEAQLALEAPPPARDEDIPLFEDTPDDISPMSSERLGPTRILSPEEVNLIRVYEIDFKRPPRVVVRADTIRSMIEKHASSSLIPANAEGRAALFREEPIRLVRLMFDLKARDLYGEVEVETEPASLSLFRQRVHNAWLITNCATSRCHGGVDAGRFVLHSRNANKPQVRYTNLLLLERTKIPDRPPLIDWDRPRDSLILQFGLPRMEARFPHPDVKGWSPVFTGTRRKFIEDFERWVRSMYQPRPDYGIELELPDLTSPDIATPADAPRVPR